MNQRKCNILSAFIMSWALLLVSSCAGIKFNAVTIAHVQSLDNQTKALVDKSSTDFSANASPIQQLKDSFQMAIAFESNRGKTNFATTNMWKAINNFVVTGFLADWSKDGKLGAAAITELKNRFDKIFSYITNLENNKVGGPDEQKTN